MLGRGKKQLSQEELWRLKDFGKAYMETSERILAIMESKSNAEIKEILDISSRLEKGNCPYGIYRVREFIRLAGIETVKKRSPPLKTEPEETEEMVTEEDMK